MSIDAYAGGAGRGAASLLYRNRDGDFRDWFGKDLMAALALMVPKVTICATCSHGTGRP